MFFIKDFPTRVVVNPWCATTIILLIHTSRTQSTSQVLHVALSLLGLFSVFVQRAHWHSKSTITKFNENYRVDRVGCDLHYRICEITLLSKNGSGCTIFNVSLIANQYTTRIELHSNHLSRITFLLINR